MRPTAVEESKHRRSLHQYSPFLSIENLHPNVKRNEIENEGSVGASFIYRATPFLGRGTCAACGDKSSYCAPLVGGTVFSLCSSCISADATESDPRTQTQKIGASELAKNSFRRGR